MDCTDGESRECYGGPPGTENVGPCKTGLELCSAGRWPGICIGDVVPRAESCNNFDDDCDGTLDNAPTVGEECAGSNGCTGARACSPTGTIRCYAPAKNECDLCGGPDITTIGDECTSDEGCIGEFVCSVDKTFGSCVTPIKNECAVCGGPAVAGLGVGCTSTDNCPGMMVCNGAGDAAVCNAPLFNECNACFPPVGTPGGTCTGDRGCVGVSACNGTGDALTCTLDTPCAHLVISEVATGSAVCNTDEFIELYNPTSRTVSLSGFALQSRSASTGTFTTLLVFGTSATIASHGFYLVASNRNSTGCSNSPSPGGYPSIVANTVVANATYLAADLSGVAGAVWLTTIDQDPTGVTDAIVIDMIGWDDNLGAQPATVFEGSNPAPAPEENNPSGSIERKATTSSTGVTLAAGGTEVTAGNGYDTDDNATNFVEQAVRVPQNTSSPVEP